MFETVAIATAAVGISIVIDTDGAISNAAR